jgi:hypothetical protein
MRGLARLLEPMNAVNGYDDAGKGLNGASPVGLPLGQRG